MVKHTLETWYHMAVKISSAYKRVIQNVDTQNVNNSIIAWGERRDITCGWKIVLVNWRSCLKCYNLKTKVG